MTTEQRIYNQAIKGTQNNPGLPATLASLLIAQAKHETGNFTSNFFKKYNNGFGYSYFPGSIYQSGGGTIADNGQPIAAYANIEDSTKEIIDWIYRRKKEGNFPDLTTITTPEKYAALLKQNNYFGDTLTNYLNGLKKFYIQVLQVFEKPSTQTGIILISIITLVYIIRKKLK